MLIRHPRYDPEFATGAGMGPSNPFRECITYTHPREIFFPGSAVGVPIKFILIEKPRPENFRKNLGIEGGYTVGEVGVTYFLHKMLTSTKMLDFNP
jgi:hypothetical protein